MDHQLFDFIVTVFFCHSPSLPLLCWLDLSSRTWMVATGPRIADNPSMHEPLLSCQLVLPHLHHCNAAEIAIHMFKNHFIAGLCSTDKDFPIHLWDHLLLHCPSTSCKDHASMPASQPGCNYTVNLISIAPQLLPLAFVYLSMKNQWPSTLGNLMAALAYMVWIMEMCAQCI